MILISKKKFTCHIQTAEVYEICLLMFIDPGEERF